MKIPFGKFQGYPLEDLPDDYFEWLQTIELRNPLRSAVCAEAIRRANAESRDFSGAPGVAVVDEIVSAGFKTLAKKYHPDVGGTHERMIEIIHAVDWIKSQPRGLL